jgi:hypothetical protein
VLSPLAAQFIQGTSLALGYHVQLGAQHRQHGQQLARTKFGPSAALEAREGFGRHARLGRYVALFQTQQLAARGDGFTEFLEGLHLIFASRRNIIRRFLMQKSKSTNKGTNKLVNFRRWRGHLVHSWPGAIAPYPRHNEDTHEQPTTEASRAAA